jgi:uncharacterized caspase-like protein
MASMANKEILLAGLLLLSFWSRPSWAQPGQVWVISVGIDDYVQESIPDLKYAGADAKLVAQSLQDLAKVPASNVFTFTSDSVQPESTPRATNILYRLHALKKLCRPQDTLIFFFAGHGMQIEQQSYLLTEDSDNRSPETLRVSSLRSDELYRQMLQMPTSKILLVFDACRNESGGGETLGEPLSTSLTLSRKNLEYSTIFSCSIGERSWEWTERKHGYFTYHFAEGLKSAAADSQGFVSLETLCRYLGQAVPASVQQNLKASQTPIFRYEGPGSDRWLLTRVQAKHPSQVLSAGEQAKLVAELDATRLELDRVKADKKAVEERSLLQAAETKKLLTRLEILERQCSGLPASESATASRDLAQRDLQQAQQSRARAQSEIEILQAEKDELRAQNNALQARIKVLELKLGKESLSASREVRLASDVGLVSRRQALDTASTAEQRLPLESEYLRREQELYLQDVSALTEAAAAKLTHLPPDPKVDQLLAQLQIYQESSTLLREQLKTSEKAKLSFERQKQEVEARLSLAQAALAQSQVEVEQLRQRLANLTLANADYQRQVVESRQRNEELLARLKQFEEQVRQKFPGVAFASEYASITRRARVSDLMFEVEPLAPDSL